ncbi:DUF6624 domain-containing protein [Kordia sp.]|uniref:DUF6624 domain-containing protein n=1 Tax=Kordia sp. TaxID=1965332 RepID=UPI003B590794
MKHLLYIFCLASTWSLFAQQNDTKKADSIQLHQIRVELETIFKKDQTFRRIYQEAEKKLGRDSFEMEYFWEVVEAQDKVLEKRVCAIIDTHGWLGISQVGRLANTTLWAVLQHGSVASKEKYAPLLKASVLQKESRAIHYARLIDRMLINSNKAQLYGTQYEYDDKGKASFFPIETPELLNKRRKELGLNSMEEFAASLKIEWTQTSKQ